MKKNLAISLALMFSLGVTGTAFAASEPDMATELANLKIRMAELEKSMVNAKVAKKDDNGSKLNFDGSDFRIRWIKDGKTGNNDSAFFERIRLNMNYKINDNITFNTRWRVENENELGKTGVVGNDGYFVSDANFAMKNVFGSTMTLGRFSQAFGATGYWNSTTIGLIDGIKFATKIDDVNVTAGYANFGAYTPPTTTFKSVLTGTTVTTIQVNTFAPKLEDTLFLNASYDTSKATTVNFMWVKEKTGVGSDFDVRGLGVNTKLATDWRFVGDYTQNYAQTNKPSGSYLSLRWKEADTKIPKSFSMRLDYRDIKTGNMFSTSGTSSNIPTDGFKGPSIGAQYATAKNVMLEAYQTFDTKNANTGVEVPNYSRIQVVMNF